MRAKATVAESRLNSVICESKWSGTAVELVLYFWIGDVTEITLRFLYQKFQSSFTVITWRIIELCLSLSVESLDAKADEKRKKFSRQIIID